MNLKDKIRNIYDYPVDGIIFRDITTLLRDKEAFHEAINQLATLAKKYNPDQIVGVEARGFIIGACLAYAMNCGFVPVRKPGKLPHDTIKESYGLEYGKDVVELHIDAINEGEKVLIVDDLLATGGTCKATANLVEELGGKVLACIFMIELVGLGGREKLSGYEVESLLKFDEK
ncbi:MAG: adenine phosphoribosyltransferase [Tissierellia bacterium]|nr:adenine phosphoribosyltransferase [Tissierellia bacterium]